MLGTRAILSRLYKGEVSADIVGRPKIWYSISAALLIFSIAGLLIKGLSFGVEFTGGSVFAFKAPDASIQQVRSTVEEAGPHQVIVQKTSSGWRVTTESLQSGQVAKVQQDLTKEFGLPNGQVSTQIIGSSWGDEISAKAWQALIVFMILIILYLSVAFEWRMALAATVALIHDLVITAGIYAWSGFEVTPATLLGFLTILGYSLYDAVVVFDMIKEVTRDLTTKTPLRTYSEAANDALNSTLVRSLNTSLVAIIPVASILFIGTWLFGAGALKDLSLALFVGILVGTYSSLCVATPLLVQLKEREPKFQELRERIKKRDASPKRQAKKTAKSTVSTSKKEGFTEEPVVDADHDDAEDDAPAAVTVRKKVVQTGPRQQPKRGTRQKRRGK